MLEKSEIKIIDGEIFVDDRGQISSLNSFDFQGIERFYFIHHPDKTVVRGWHGHQFEKKWFYCVKGTFTIGLVKIDDWGNPSIGLEAEIVTLKDTESKILCVPEGYANCIKASQDGSILMVYSGKKIPEAYSDSWRYDKNMWVSWENY